MSVRGDLKEFVDAVTWQGTVEGPEFLLYAIRYLDQEPFRPPATAKWPGTTTIIPFLMHDKDWPFIVDSWAIRAETFPKEIEERLKAALSDLVEQGAVVSWLMFDGAFNDVSRLFLEWESKQTYGIGLPGEPVRLALSRQERESHAWKNYLYNARQYLIGIFPGLRV